MRVALLGCPRVSLFKKTPRYIGEGNRLKRCPLTNGWPTGSGAFAYKPQPLGLEGQITTLLMAGNLGVDLEAPLGLRSHTH